MWNKVGASPAFFIAEIDRPTGPKARVQPAMGGRFDPMGVEDRLRPLVESRLLDLGLELDYLQVMGKGPRVVRVIVDQAGGVGVDQLAQASRALSRGLDELDPFDGAYSLEVTSPGLERSLHTPDHYRKSIGREVVVKTRLEIEGSRHLRGRLESAGKEGIEVRVDDDLVAIDYGSIRSGRTRFEWNKPNKPTK